MRLKLLISFVFLSLLAISCEKQPEGKKEGGNGGKQEGRRQELTLTPVNELNAGTAQVNSHASLIGSSHLTPVAGTYVRLDNSMVVEEKPIYPRFTRTAAGDYLMFYHGGNASTWAGNECSYARSADLVDWTFEKKFMAATAMTDCTGASNKRGYAGPHPLLLPNGDILVVAATRAISNFRARVPDNGLAIRISSDNGHSWTSDNIVFVGSNWEPMPVLLHDGRIQIYYTDSQKLNSDAFGAGKEVISTGSSYIESSDNGRTWTYGGTAFSDHKRGFAQVRYTYGVQKILTDQMPAVIALNGTNKLAAAAESFIGGADYTTYISLAWSDDNGSWGTPDADGRLPEERIDKFTLGAAPYLVQFPSGETLLSYNRSSVYYMRMGDATAHNFGPEIKVFAKDASTGKGFWGSMYCVNPHLMVAGVGGNGGVMQVGQFYLNHAISAASHPVTVDGNNDDWKKADEALWICSLGDTKATVRCAQDAQNLYFLFEVSDTDISNSDYVQLFFADPEGSEIRSSSVRVKASMYGLKNQGNYAGGWKESDLGAKVSASYDGSVSYNADTDNGYVVEISIPRASLPIKNGKLLMNCSLFDIRNGGEDAIIPTGDKATEKWIPVLGL